MNPYTGVPLTPPMSSSEGSRSPQAQYTILVPSANGDYGIDPYISPHLFNSMSIEEQGPHLQILEQPVEKFRFRYKSEMAGTHGSLSGQNSEKNRKQSFPTVELRNYSGHAIIRCGLYQYNPNMEQMKLQPHAHRLVQKEGNRDVDDPHDKHLNGKDGYVTIFNNMGIIHTAKKYLVDEIKKKKGKLKLEEIARTEGRVRQLKTSEEVELQRQASEDAKTMNLNIVCLRFDAFKEDKDGILYPICPPIYSHAINNLKSALTGELKIVRMDACTSPMVGGQEVYLLVEKVTKRNIKVRFFELDTDDNEVWSDYAYFNDIDVHHQYAIVIKTPPYGNPSCENDVKVYIELVRPSDGARSHPLDFTYNADRVLQRRKRRRIEIESSSSFSSSEFPVTLQDTPEIPGICEINSSELMQFANCIPSEEFNNVLRSIQPDTPLTPSKRSEAIYLNPQMGPAQDCVKKIKGRQFDPVNLIQINAGDVQMLKKTYSELMNFIKTNPPKPRVKLMLEHQSKTLYKDGNNALMVAAQTYGRVPDSTKYVDLLLYLIKSLKTESQLEFTNNTGETVAHIAVKNDSNSLLNKLCNEMNFTMQDNDGNTALHVSILLGHKNNTAFDKLLKSPHVKDFIDTTNNEGYTAIQLAVKYKNLKAIKMLVDKGAKISVIDNKNGDNLLHMAIEGCSVDIVKFFIENTSIEINHANYQGLTCQAMAKTLNKCPIEICTIIENKMKELGIFREYIKDEPESESEEMEFDDIVKTEIFISEDIRGMFEEIVSFSDDCLDKLSAALGNKWKTLAEQLELAYILSTDLCSNAKEFFEYALTRGISVYQIRMKLEDSGEFECVKYIDDMVKSNFRS